MKKQNVQYVVDKKNRVVIATIDDCRWDAVDKINKKFIHQATSKMEILPLSSDMLMPNRFKAVARCCPEDEWDENVGKRLACERLTEKYEKSLNRRMARFMVDMDKVIDEMSKYLEGKEL